MKKLIAFTLLISNLIALEFGQMGNTPASVGGAGVAYKKNAWAVYYNPALLGANRQASIAYSFGVGYTENKDANISKVSSMMDTIKNLNAKIEEMGFTTHAGVSNQPVVVTFGARNGTATQAGTWNFKDVTIFDLGYVLGHLTGKTDDTGTSDDLKNYLCKKAGKEGDTSCTLDTVATDLKDMTDKLTEIKNELQEAIDTTTKEHPNDSTKLGILGSLVSNIDADKITGLIDGIKDGNIDIETIIKEVGGSVKISKNTNPVVEEIFTLLDMIEKKTIGVANISSNNGIAWHIKGNKNRGAIGMGLLVNIYGFSSMEIDKTHSLIIIKTKNNNQDKYFKVGISGDKIELSSSDDTNFNSSSIFSPNAQHSINANALAITEIPIAYGHTLPLPLGELHLGATLKYIFATSMDNSMANITLHYDSEGKIKPDFDFGLGNTKDNLRYTHTFGVDLGALWTLDWLSTGIVVKNLNAPTIRTANGKYRILPQVRAGVSAEIWKLTFLADIDLTPNDTLEPGKKNQMIGGGVILDLNWVDFRFGVMGDMHKNPYGPIFTAGLNIVHFLDFTVQTSTKLIDTSGVSDKTGGIKRMPNYFKVSFGGRFQW